MQRVIFFGTGGGHLRVWCVGGRAEAAVKVCGVAVAVLPGYSWAPTWLIGYVVNVGTAGGCPLARVSGLGDGQVRCRLLVTGGTEAP